MNISRVGFLFGIFSLVGLVACLDCDDRTGPPLAELSAALPLGALTGDLTFSDPQRLGAHATERLTLAFSLPSTIDPTSDSCTSNLSLELREVDFSAEDPFLSTLEVVPPVELAYHWEGENWKPGRTVTADSVLVKLRAPEGTSYTLLLEPLLSGNPEAAWRGVFSGKNGSELARFEGEPILLPTSATDVSGD
ncbi:MAG: hypothetical protein A2284_11830 [Deltaproteobacteria bacterium RIFOXYA12_FULL_61_11]|nr:MAG: hypothetical protein A2284_11830 [Deltaproteobacteria bacterium RIFOXYA12_FULL_61_11]